MQGIRFWILQYLLAIVTIYLVLVGIDLFNGKTLSEAVWRSPAWALTVSAVFIIARYSQSRKR